MGVGSRDFLKRVCRSVLIYSFIFNMFISIDNDLGKIRTLLKCDIRIFLVVSKLGVDYVLS